MTHAIPELTVIATCFNEETTIAEFHERLSGALRKMGRTHEIIYVNDGSRDATFAQLQALYEKDESIAVAADLMFNVGQPTAITVGFVHARGEKVVIMDSDLQLAPEEMSLLLETFDEGYAILNDSEPDVGGDMLEALEAYKVKPVPWPRRKEVVQKLVA